MISLWLLIGLALADDSVAFHAWVGEIDSPQTRPIPATQYRFAADIFTTIAELVTLRPGVITVEEFGQSTAETPLWAFHIAEPGVEITEKSLVFANIHAMEWISSEVALDLLVELVHAPIRGRRVTVIPVLNPDGRQKVEDDLIAEKNLYRRGNLHNVDLNRDFAHHRDTTAIWKSLLPSYYTTSPGPLSQVETQALDVLASRENYNRAVSLHAFGGFFYYPWSGRFQIPEDRDVYVTSGRVMEQAQGPRAYKTRQLSHWGFFFRALGTELDHFYAEYGTQSWLIELTRSGINPLRLSDWTTRFRLYNPRDPHRHREAGLGALRALLREPTPSAPR